MDPKEAILKTKSATIFFFFFASPPFPLLALSFSPFLFFRYCDFGASRAYESCLLMPFYSSAYCKFRKLGFQKIR